ncbi:MFS transporter [Pseudomonas sp. ICMP 561]|uniref:MFS transporter n=1 Tax=Pseudomonas sp. ICMP 561 TaxID=1718918 RepID=UPI000C077E05|nr:MFS transporter [Pseudomonas sp. ICMP 561]PHN17158.1 hypothetical protein AO242_20895 [Pseudomonas sp. ICMP 561]
MKPLLTGAARASVIYFAVLSWMLPYLVAYNVQGLTTRFGLNEAEAGWMVSAELFALAISAIVTGPQLSRFDKRKVVGFGAGLAFVSLGLSLSNSVPWMFAVTKILCGAGLGMVVAVVYSIPVSFAHPERFYAHSAMAISIVYSVALFVLPLIIQAVNTRGLELLELAMLLNTIWFVRKLPDTKADQICAVGQPVPLTREGNTKRRQLLISIFVLFLAQSATVGMVFILAVPLVIDMNHLGIALMLSAVLQLPAGFAISKLGNRLGMLFPIFLGTTVLAFVYYSIFLGSSPLAFLVAVALLSTGVTFISPYQLAGIALYDASGRSSSLGGALANFGNAAGPALAGVFYVYLDASGLGWAAILLLGVTFLMASNALRSPHRYKPSIDITPL